MSNRRSKQQTKIARQRISSILILIVLLLMFLYFLSFSIRNMIICKHINSKELEEYSGTYTIRRSHRGRNTIYFVTLKNGDVLRIAPELLKSGSDFSELSTLHFTYSEPEYGLTTAYTCVGISSVDGVNCYMEIADSINEAKTGVYIGVSFGVLIFAGSVPLLNSLKKK